MKVSDAVIQFLERQGIEHVFTLPGGHAMHLNDSLGQSKKITPVFCLHEQACAVAAEAYTRVNGKVSAVLVTAGPGALNTLTGLAGAWYDSTPVLFISGQVSTADLRRSENVRQYGLQQTNIVPIVKSLCKYAVQAQSDDLVLAWLEIAYREMISDRPGPVWIEIPIDVQGATVELLEPTPLVQPKERREPWSRDLADFNRILAASHKPVIVAGNGIRIAGAINNFRGFLRDLPIPVVTSRLGVDLIHNDYHLLIGQVGEVGSPAANLTVQNADLVVLLGARLTPRLTAYNPDGFAPHAKIIMVDIDESELNRDPSRIDLPIHSDLLRFFEQYVPIDIPNNWESWGRTCGDKRDVLNAVTKERQFGSMYTFSESLSNVAPYNAIILSGSSGLACDIFSMVLKVKAEQRVFYNQGTVAMGLGIPAAIGASLAAPGRPVICVEGDGGFQLNIQELETIRRLDLPIKIFVINNNGYAMIRQSQMTHFGRVTGADPDSGLTFPSLRELVEAYLLEYREIDSWDIELTREHIEECLSHPGPLICEVIVDPNEVRAPRFLNSLDSPYEN